MQHLSDLPTYDMWPGFNHREDQNKAVIAGRPLDHVILKGVIFLPMTGAPGDLDLVRLKAENGWMYCPLNQKVNATDVSLGWQKMYIYWLQDALDKSDAKTTRYYAFNKFSWNI
jgi:hypothetical protein